MNRSLCSPVTLIAIVCSAGFAVGDEPPSDTTGSKGLVLFDTQIKPALARHCYECHSKNAEDIAAGLELDSPTGKEASRGDADGSKIRRLRDRLAIPSYRR